MRTRWILSGMALVALLQLQGCTKVCAVNADCPSDQSCAFKIGSCDEQGECVSTPASSCFAQESLCGCGSGTVTTGCEFPAGYASGPTLDSQQCASLEGSTPADAGS